MYAPGMWSVLRGLLVLLVVMLSACSPQTPTITPNSVQVTGVGVAGVRMRADLNAHNPNGYSLTVQSVSGRIVLNGTVPLGNATTVARVELPANGWQRFFVDLDLPWLNLPAALAIAHSQPQVPYTFEGNATVGGTLSITVPIRTQGTIPAQQLLLASVGMPVARLEPAWWRRGTLLVASVEDNPSVGGGLFFP